MPATNQTGSAPPGVQGGEVGQEELIELAGAGVIEVKPAHLGDEVFRPLRAALGVPPIRGQGPAWFRL
jgi:hypothetical protein